MNQYDNKEIERVIYLSQYCIGHGADIGCGRYKCTGAIGVDIDPKVKSDIVASAEKLPFKNCELDYIVSSHCLEHLVDTKKVLKEWDRVLKVGGILAIIVPDSDLKRGTILEQTHKVAFTKNNMRQLIGVYMWYELLTCRAPKGNIEHNKNKSDILCVGQKRMKKKLI